MTDSTTTHDEMRAALAAATPGPWVDMVGTVFAGEVRSADWDHICDDPPGDDRAADRHLIANAPTWLSELLAENALLRKDVADLTAAGEGACAELVAERDAALARWGALREAAYNLAYHGRDVMTVSFPLCDAVLSILADPDAAVAERDARVRAEEAASLRALWSFCPVCGVKAPRPGSHREDHTGRCPMDEVTP